jgi:tRNA A-37 threonylcarbamoyl transferase component Bud32
VSIQVLLLILASSVGFFFVIGLPAISRWRQNRAAAPPRERIPPAMFGLAGVAILGMAVIAAGYATGGYSPLGRSVPANDAIGFLFLAAVAVGCGFFALHSARRNRPQPAAPVSVPAPGRRVLAGLGWWVLATVVVPFVIFGATYDHTAPSKRLEFLDHVRPYFGVWAVVVVIGVVLIARAIGGGKGAAVRHGDHDWLADRGVGDALQAVVAPAARPRPIHQTVFGLAAVVAVGVVALGVWFATELGAAGGRLSPAPGIAFIVAVGLLGILLITAVLLRMSRTVDELSVQAAETVAADGGGEPRRSPRELRTCPKCSAPIAADAPQGLCPRCLLQGVFASAVSPMNTAAYTGPYTAPSVEDAAAFFPQLEVLDKIGQGGMGAVYKARQPNLDRVVALKLIRPREDDPTFAERFSREAKALARLSHPNIVTVYEFGEAGGSQYLLMEFVDGVTLRDAMRTKSLAPQAALKVIGQICDALQFAHSRGVVHRDIKPENILLAKDGTAKIADFGLAKVTDPDGLTLTRTHQAMGTPHYMAPEQWETPAAVDHRADIFALGVVFYELLTGELPLGRFDPPSKKVQIDVRIDEVVLRALAREPGRRYQAVADVWTDLENIGKYPQRKPACYPQPSWEYKSKRTFLGLPLVHIVHGPDPITGKPRWATGVVAIGGMARGGLAIGGMAFGVVSIGGVSFGGLAIGGASVGLFAFGGMAIALLAACGGLAIAPLFALGGRAIGYFAMGGEATGRHILDEQHHNPEQFRQAVREFFESIGNVFTGA